MSIKPELIETIFVSIVTTGLFVGMLKLILDRSLTHKLRQLEKEHVASITEQYRIQGKIFDDRYTAYKEISRLIAVAFERSKSMVIFAEKGWFGDFYSYANSMYQIKDSLTAVTTDYRAVIERNVKEKCGDAINVVGLLTNMYSPQEEQLPEYAEIHHEVLERLKKHVQDLQEIDSAIEKFGWNK